MSSLLLLFSFYFWWLQIIRFSSWAHLSFAVFFFFRFSWFLVFVHFIWNVFFCSCQTLAGSWDRIFSSVKFNFCTRSPSWWWWHKTEEEVTTHIYPAVGTLWQTCIHQTVKLCWNGSRCCCSSSLSSVLVGSLLFAQN